ncbi:hypothetical protein F4810DRAFT_537967 [Camillea tinctor]|nr:hypothetical protein F4810DRAFT_537967 [Camillea tinctor]
MSSSNSNKQHTNAATRAIIVALKSPFFNMSTRDIHSITGVPERTINNVYKRACDRGFDPQTPILTIKDEWLVDSPRSGRPRRSGEDDPGKHVVSRAARNRFGHDKSEQSRTEETAAEITETNI